MGWRRRLPSSNSSLAAEAEFTDKGMWGVPCTVCTTANRGSLLGIWFGLLHLQGSPPAVDHKCGRQLLVVTGLEIWGVERRTQRGGASGIGEVSRPAGQGRLERLCALFQSRAIPAAPACSAFSAFRGCPEGQEEGFARILRVASEIGKSSYGI